LFGGRANGIQMLVELTIKREQRSIASVATPPVPIGPSVLVSGFLIRAKRASLAIVASIPGERITAFATLTVDELKIGEHARFIKIDGPPGGLELDVLNASDVWEPQAQWVATT
jgi:hypothetical protein